MVLIAMTWLALPVAAQSADSDILSKDDARLLFAMSKRQWEENIRGAVASGMATRTLGALPGMKVSAPMAPVTTRLDFSRGATRPAAVHVLVEFQPGQSPFFTDAMVQEMLADTQRQMAPEFNVSGRADRPVPDGLSFHFLITERAR